MDLPCGVSVACVMEIVKVEPGERKTPSMTVRENDVSVSPSANVYCTGTVSTK